MEQKSNSSKSSIFKSQLVTGDKSELLRWCWNVCGSLMPAGILCFLTDFFF